MKRCLVIVVTAGVLFLWAFFAGSSGDAASSQFRTMPARSSLEPETDFGNIPLYFIPNRGQADGRALFSARAAGFTLWATRDGLIFDQSGSLGAPRPAQLGFGGAVTPGAYGPAQLGFGGAVTSLIFLGSRPDVEVAPEGETSHRANFIHGQDPAGWRTGIPTSSAVRYRGLYPGIDLKVYGAGRRIEYDWVISPGADPAGIRLSYNDARDTRLDAEGNLVVDSAAGEISHRKPDAYQEINGRRVAVACRYERLGDDTYGYRVGRYDRRRPLVIDPLVLVWSSYIGGDHYEYAAQVKVDAWGNAIVAGSTESADFPLEDPLYPALSGKTDVYVAKIAPAGNALLFSTFIGGTAQEYAYGLAVDKTGAAIVGGMTSSRDFPTKKAYDPVYNGGSSDAFLLKLSAAGDALLFSTYLGGTDRECANAIALDAAGGIAVAGNTSSKSFPVVNAYDKTFNGNEDAFIARFTADGKTLTASTFLGGKGYELAFGIAVDAGGRVHVAGYTESANFPVKNALNPTIGGNVDGFLTILSSTGKTLVASTFIGGAKDDLVFSLALDGTGAVYLGGMTESADFPVRAAFDPGYNGNDDAFVIKLKPLASAIVFSTYLGGSEDEGAYAIAVDAAGGVVVTGWTDSPTFPVLNAFDATLSGKWDAFVTKLQPSGRTLAFSTFLGGGRNEEPSGLALDDAGGIYVCGGTDSKNFPRKSAFDPVYGGRSDGFVTKFRWR